MYFIMRKRFIDHDEIVSYCKIPRIVKDLTSRFKLTGSQVNKIMTNLVNEKRILMEKVSGEGALKNVYVDINESKYHQFKSKKYDFKSLPAHDPFGLAKGGANARR